MNTSIPPRPPRGTKASFRRLVEFLADGDQSQVNFRALCGAVLKLEDGERIVFTPGREAVMAELPKGTPFAFSVPERERPQIMSALRAISNTKAGDDARAVLAQLLGASH